MTTNVKRRTRTPQLPGLPDEMREYLLTGHHFAPGKPDESEARRYWQIYKGELLSYWIQDPTTWKRGDLSPWGFPTPAGPCHRPLAWWQYSELPEPRRVLDWDAMQSLEAALLGTDTGGRKTQRLLLATPETDFEYLARHKLLSAGELRWLA